LLLKYLPLTKMLDEKQPGYVDFNKFLKVIYKIYTIQYLPADDNKLWRVFKVIKNSWHNN